MERATAAHDDASEASDYSESAWVKGILKTLVETQAQLASRGPPRRNLANVKLPEYSGPKMTTR